jgi:hypothetical protein
MATPLPARVRVADLAPSSEELRREATEDPHQAPRSLLRFAERVGRKLGPALQDESVALRLMPELAECLERPNLAPQIQAVCLNGAGSLARAHASLGPQYERLRERAPAEARRIVELRDSLLKEEGSG